MKDLFEKQVFILHLQAVQHTFYFIIWYNVEWIFLKIKINIFSRFEHVFYLKYGFQAPQFVRDK